MARTDKISAIAKTIKIVKPVPYRQIIADHIIEQVLNGFSINAICQKLGISKSCVGRWSVDNPDFKAQLALAREAASFLMAEETIDIADNNKINPQQAKNQIQVRQWLASKYNRQQFGDKHQVEVSQKTHEFYLDQLVQPEYMRGNIIDATPE